jgi:hypothetical protein
MDLRSTIPWPVAAVPLCVFRAWRGVPVATPPLCTSTFPLILGSIDFHQIRSCDPRPRIDSKDSLLLPTNDQEHRTRHRHQQLTSIPHSLSQVRITHSFSTKHERNPSAQQLATRTDRIDHIKLDQIEIQSYTNPEVYNHGHRDIHT